MTRDTGRREFIAATGTVSLSLLAGCGESTDGGSTTTETEPDTATDEPASGQVTVVHDTHLHGRFGSPDDPANIATYFGVMADIAADADNVLRIGSGDDLAASVMSSTFDGRHMVDAFDAGGLDYDTFGNHDFDMGPDVLRERVAEGETTWVSANAVNTETEAIIASEQGAQRFALHEAGAVTVGVTGVIHTQAPDVTSMGANAAVRDPVTALDEVVPQMREAGADLVVVASHVSAGTAEQIASEVAGIDAIVGDHTATARSEPTVVDDTYLSFVGDEFEYVGELELTVDAGERSAVDFRVHETATEVENGVEPHPDVQGVLDEYTAKLDEQLSATIGRTEVTLETRESVIRRREANFPNYIADVQRRETGADACLLNAGGMQSDTRYQPGELTKETIINTLPFPNNVVVLELSGETLQRALENGVSKVADGSGRFPQVSGMAYSYDPSAAVGERVSDVTVGGESLSASASYTVATNDFVAGGGDSYEMLTDATRRVPANEGDLLSALVIDYVERDSPIAPETTGRITRL